MQHCFAFQTVKTNQLSVKSQINKSLLAKIKQLIEEI